MSSGNFMKIKDGFGHMRYEVLWSHLATPTTNHVKS